MVNKESLKVSKKAKNFLEQIILNRIKLGKSKLNSFSEAIELIQEYFKKKNTEYLNMLNEEDKNVF